nr:hypothetical protein BSM_10300 [uncultured archaeon]
MREIKNRVEDLTERSKCDGLQAWIVQRRGDSFLKFELDRNRNFFFSHTDISFTISGNPSHYKIIFRSTSEGCTFKITPKVAAAKRRLKADVNRKKAVFEYKDGKGNIYGPYEVKKDAAGTEEYKFSDE